MMRARKCWRNLDPIPECFALIKMKRRLGDVYRLFPKALEELVDE
jgi:hypothetical protein